MLASAPTAVSTTTTTTSSTASTTTRTTRSEAATSASVTPAPAKTMTAATSATSTAITTATTTTTAAVASTSAPSTAAAATNTAAVMMTTSIMPQPPPARPKAAEAPLTTTTTTTTTTPPPATPTTTTMDTAAPTRATITSDPGILCFHHCNVKVFCFTLPHICPNCKTELDATPSGRTAAMGANTNGPATGGGINVGGGGGKLLPFRLPYPFVRASQYPCAIVLRPSLGDFLNDYNNATDLHIAVTTSTGSIVEFDRHGLRRHRRPDAMAEWRQCLLVGDVPEAWYDYWDQTLLQTCKQPSRWTIDQYIEDAHNCYTFVLAFLQALAYEALSEAARSKTAFCERYIVPRTTTAGKYISLYRKLRSTGMYVHRSSGSRHHHQGVAGAGARQQLVPLQHAKTKRGRLLGGGGGGSGGGVKGTYSPHVSLTAPLPRHGKSAPTKGHAPTAAAMPTARIPTLCTIEE